MTALSFRADSWMPSLINHLWQSTAVVAILWVLTAALQRHRAEVRFRIWLLASARTECGSSPTLHDQLGLKLRPETLPTQVLVIDPIERPSAN